MLALDATFNRRVVRVAVGDVMRLDLPEDVVAGSRWALPDPLPPQLRLVVDKTASDREVAYPAGDRRLEFRIIAQGTFSLSLVNARRWQQAATVFELFVEAYEADLEPRVTHGSRTHLATTPTPSPKRG